MLIWDTGEYEVLPYEVETKGPETETEGSEDEAERLNSRVGALERRTESEKLNEAFRNVGSVVIRW